MQPRPRWTSTSTVARPGCLVCILLLICPVQLHAERTLRNIVSRENLSVSHRDELTQRLRAITGWSDLMFDQNGALRLGKEEPVGGSKSARALLAKATTGNNVIVLEDASGRPDVVFCRVVPGRWKRGASQQPPAYVVLIDFADFQQVLGDQLARSAFNVGWAVLHELDHVVNDSGDPDLIGSPGECENHINAMRREVNLPERADYFFTPFPVAKDSDFTTRIVRLAFEQRGDLTNKRKRYWLVWDATLVGGLDEQQIASLGYTQILSRKPIKTSPNK